MFIVSLLFFSLFDCVIRGPINKVNKNLQHILWLRNLNEKSIELRIETLEKKVFPKKFKK